MSMEWQTAASDWVADSDSLALSPFLYYSGPATTTPIMKKIGRAIRRAVSQTRFSS